MIKANRRNRAFLIAIIVMITVLMVVLLGSVGGNTAHAEETVNDELFLKLSDMTKDLSIEVNNETKDIIDYSNYLGSRFQLNNKRYNVQNIVDEWILKIIPIELFKQKQKQKFFYIGNAYGFYLNYDSSSERYLVYLILNNYCYNNGLLVREIRPLYYEQYVFNETTETVSLVYMDYIEYPDPENLPNYKEHYYHYRKHSNYEKLYLKDVNFTGSLYNENHLNKDEYGYDPHQDKGGYFVQSQYRFKGVSTQSGKLEFENAILQIGLGYIPLGTSGLAVGDVLNVASTITELAKFANNAVDDFRGTVTNEMQYKNDEFFGMQRDMQIDNFGKLIKSSVTQIQTNNTTDAILLGINSDNYARNEWLINYYTQDDMWNTRFIGNVSLDIVKEVSTLGGSRVEEIAKGISAVTPCSYSINNGEETIIEENEDGQLYILNDAKHKVSFTAPENGIYTIKTFGEIKNKINSQLGEITSIDSDTNNKLLVTLKKGQNLKLDVTKNSFIGSGFIGVDIKFTPEEIGKGETKALTIAPNEREFFVFMSEDGMSAFDFNVTSQQQISLEILQSNLSNSKYYLTGINIEGSMITNTQQYFIGIQNNSSASITVLVTVAAVAVVEPTNSIEMNVLDKKIVILSAPYSAGVSINVDSEAPIYMKLYDENNNLINLTTSSDQAVIKQHIQKNKLYYILLENFSYAHSNINISVDWEAYELVLGNNNLNEANVDDMYVYNNKQLEASFTVLSNCNFIMYDKDFNVLTPDSEGCFTFLSQEIYYFITQSENDNCIVTIELDYTEETSGTYSLKGSKYIKYAPTRTSAYKVEGATNYSWYSEGLQPCGAYLYVGYTYYLKIEGNPLQQYNINIIMNRNQVPIGRVTNLLSGYYYFNIEETGEYSFRTYCSNDISSTVSIYNEHGEIIVAGGQPCENINIDIVETDISLGKGLYYIDLNVSSDTIRVGLKISKK